MSYTETESEFEDPILALAKDPNLNKEKGKTLKIILLIQGFPIVERKVSRLCQLSLTILQTLEKIELNLKNWAFMSLDINSINHFDTTSSSEIKIFNNNVSFRVIQLCQELTQKLNKITADLDFITNALRSLSPIEFISDSGSLLTSLTLRNIKLKDELRDKVTIAYLKAKLITIGTDLEVMLVDGDADQKATVESYKHFVVSLLNQLNQAVEDDDIDERNECLAVINDMEQMFEVYKLERAHATTEKLLSEKETIEAPDALESGPADFLESVSGKDSLEYFAMVPRAAEYSDEYESSDETSMSHSTTLYVQPTVHSITKQSNRTSDSGSSSVEPSRKGSFSSFASTSILQKSTLSEELPYLMSAFNLAKTLEEDVHHFKVEEGGRESQEKKLTKKVDPSTPQPMHTTKQQLPHKKSLPETSLYSESQILNRPMSSPGAYLYANNSLLSKFGIKPQVITADLPRHLGGSYTFNKSIQLGTPDSPTYDYGSNLLNGKKEDKENTKANMFLTKENLETHTLKSLVQDASMVADYVE